MVALDTVFGVKTTETPGNTYKTARLAPSWCISAVLLWEESVPHLRAVADQGGCSHGSVRVTRACLLLQELCQVRSGDMVLEYAKQNLQKCY